VKCWFHELTLPTSKPHLPTPSEALVTAFSYATHLFRAALVLAALQALRPLFGPTDDISDIPLTPRQRSLLGLRPIRLSPSSLPGTPGTPGSAPGSPAVAGYVTPPRFVRAASGALASSAVASSRAATLGSSPPTPGGRTPSSAGARGSVGSGAPSPFGPGGSLLRGPARNDFSLSPAGASPLVRKAVHGKRWSLGGGGLGESAGAGVPGSPSPAPAANGGSRTPSVTLSNKWLYQRQWSGNGPARYV
jgi:nucleoporin POM34